MKALFGLKADDYNELPTFVGVVKDTPEDIRNQVIGEFLRLHKTSQHITSDNEATRCEFISRIIYGIYGSEIKVYPQYEISGSHDKGPVNWAIKIGNIIIIITEAKRGYQSRNCIECDPTADIYPAQS
ncbi:uncharacterized protein OCT59_013490 [Rhizophagus irregularis]|uniref:Uncharacterized protein n=1 Tax=Rhizophagus irregularis (strain DAOM 197198w) TaxID=1432141 RepID=A0A015M5J5_RHIIW|nr:hypothetical protein RirG_164990 [Rhizophagus irregularis DAOM 197198w]UZO21087.1 hypothetical protein OCT59_013490 [Rhizophagus irregularis]GBC45592.1 hypothetical protein GLOIN_2v1635553 [Rhizophagus irregularis DAOM 181602=DAOM 197198]